MLVISAIQHRGEIFGNNIAVIEKVTCVPFHAQKAVQKLDSKVLLSSFYILDHEYDSIFINDLNRLISKRTRTKIKSNPTFCLHKKRKQ
jgi:hypothetical protein